MNMERFLTYVSKPAETDCWLWIGGLTGKGYGKCGHNYRTLGAHVMSYMLFKGEIETGKVVRHTCNIKHCVNPDHLKIGTYSDNLKDRLSNGEKLGVSATYDKAAIFRILDLRRSMYTSAKIAEELNIPISFVSQIISENCRKEVIEEYIALYGPIPKFHAGHKLTAADRKEIVRLYREGIMRPTDIADQFGTTYKYVYKLAKYSVHA